MRLGPQLTSLQLKIDNYAAMVYQVFDRLITLSEQLSNHQHDTKGTRIAYIKLIQDAADEFKKEEDIASIYRELKRFEALKELLNTRPPLSTREEMYEGVINNLETNNRGLRTQLDERERALSSNGHLSSGEGDKGFNVTVAAPRVGVVDGFDHGTPEFKKDKEGEDIGLRGEGDTGGDSNTQEMVADGFDYETGWAEDIEIGLRGGMGDSQLESVDEDSFVIY